MTPETIHIGKIIQRRLKEEERTVTWLANKLNCDRSSVYRLFDREIIDTDLLFKLSKILDYNFFDIYSREFKAMQGLKSGD